MRLVCATLHRAKRNTFFSCLIIKGSAIDQSALRSLRARGSNKRFCRSNISSRFLIVPLLNLLFLRLLFNGQHIPVLLMPLVIGAQHADYYYFFEESRSKPPTHNFKPFYYCVLTVIRAHNSKYPECDQSQPILNSPILCSAH